MKIEWNPAMSVGEDNIDAQHQKLLDQINKLLEELSQGVDLGPVRDTIKFLGEYIDEHFTYEEEYMAKNGFPGLAAHKEIHNKFVEFYKEFNKKFMKLYSTKDFSAEDLKLLLEEAKEYLGEWLIKHILGDDQVYAKFIENK